MGTGLEVTQWKGEQARRTTEHHQPCQLFSFGCKAEAQREAGRSLRRQTSMRPMDPNHGL